MAESCPGSGAFLSGWQDGIQRRSRIADLSVMTRSITIIAVTGLLATVGLTFAMSQALKMAPDKMGEGEIKELFSFRFHSYSESEPKMQIEQGSAEGRIRVKVWIEPKVTVDRQRLEFTLRDFLWRAAYKSGLPESVRVVYRDPVTGRSKEKQMLEIQVQPRPWHQSKKPAKKTAGKTAKTRNAQPEESSTVNPGQKPQLQSVPRALSGRGFKSQSSSSKTR